MNPAQKALLWVFLPITAVIVLLDNLFPGAVGVNYFKFAVIASLFLSALALRNRFREQVILNAAMFFAVVGDFFLNLCSTLPKVANGVLLYGEMAFLVAYLLIIWVFAKGFRVGPKELLAAVPVLGVFIPNLAALMHHISWPQILGFLLFGLMLAFMAWVSACAPLSGCYRPDVSRYMSLAGLLIFISDIALAHSLFNPDFAGHFVPWLKNIIWGAYVPAWTLVAVIIADDRLY